MDQQIIINKDYNWKFFSKRVEIAYKEFLTGNKELIQNHNILKDGEREILFALSLSKICFNNKPHGRALDVGCGCGYMSQCLTELGFNTTGFDLAEDGIKIAKSSFPEISFFVGDGTVPKKYFKSQIFDIIHIREFYPFKVINDFDYQLQIIEDYLDILTEQGIIIITHAKPGTRNYDGEFKRYKGLHHKSLIQHFRNSQNIKTAGPFFYFLFKHLGVSPNNKINIIILSSLTKALQIITRQPWIEIFLIFKSRLSE